MDFIIDNLPLIFIISGAIIMIFFIIGISILAHKSLTFGKPDKKDSKRQKKETDYDGF